VRIQRYSTTDVGTEFLVYDETKSNEAEERKKLETKFAGAIIPSNKSRKEFFDDFYKLIFRFRNSIWGRANGHPTLAAFRVEPTGNLKFEFKENIEFSEADLKLIFRKAKAARSRLQKKAA